MILFLVTSDDSHSIIDALRKSLSSFITFNMKYYFITTIEFSYKITKFEFSFFKFKLKIKKLN